MSSSNNRAIAVQNISGLLRYLSTLGGVHQPVNSYFLETPQGAVLIDPAADLQPDDLPALPAAILVTHVQEEHITGAANFPGVPLYAPAGDEYLCEGSVAYWNTDITWQAPWDWDTRGNYQGHIAGARNERPPVNPLPVAGTITAGDEIFGLRALATPGHGKNALTLLAKVGGKTIAFCGDVLFGNGQLWNWFDSEWDYGLQTGQRTLCKSAHLLREQNADLLLPAHGEPVENTAEALSALEARLETILAGGAYNGVGLNIPEKDSPGAEKIDNGWRELSPSLHQWRDGNAAILVSKTGNALLVDDGLCYWQPVAERAAYHRKVIANIKESLGVSKIEVVIPSHYHGDHIEYIPHLVEEEGTKVLCLEDIADVVEHAERYNLASPLPWYGATFRNISVHERVPSGSIVKWHEYDLEFFLLGGQTYYSAGIKTQVDGATVLFVGDAIGGTSLDVEPVLCYNDCDPETRGWAFALDRQIEREPDLLVCGHGAAVRAPMEMLHEKRARWSRHMEEFALLNPRENTRLFFDPFYTSS